MPNDALEVIRKDLKEMAAMAMNSGVEVAKDFECGDVHVLESLQKFMDTLNMPVTMDIHPNLAGRDLVHIVVAPSLEPSVKAAGGAVA